MSQNLFSVPAAEANRSFSKLLRAARGGTRITITSHGEPVAILGPVEVDTAAVAHRRAALDALESHWAGLTPTIVDPWTRDELYERTGE